MKMGMMKLGAPTNRHLLILLPGEVILKARTTVTVFVKTMKTATQLQMWFAAGCR
jgi:hypothetical protein